MQFTLAVLPPNCSRCDLSMTKIQNFSGGACPQTPLLGRASRAITLDPLHFKRAGAGPGRRKAWFRCHLTVHVYFRLQRIISNLPKKFSNPPFNPAYGPVSPPPTKTWRVHPPLPACAFTEYGLVHETRRRVPRPFY